MTDKQIDLRDRIAEALYAHDHPGHLVPLNETGMGPAYRESADAVLAVLPPPADRTAMNAAQSLLLRAADLVAERASDLWAPDSKAHAEMLGDAAELRRLAAEAQQQPDTETPAYDRTAWEAYRRDAGCACTSPDPSTCAVSHRSGPWLCVCHRLSAELTEEERAALFPERQFDRPESTWAAPREALCARLTAERRENVPHEPDAPEKPSGAR